MKELRTFHYMLRLKLMPYINEFDGWKSDQYFIDDANLEVYRESSIEWAGELIKGNDRLND